MNSNPTLTRARRAFEEAFGGTPMHAARAPGRVNLIGDHTDYTGGLVLPMAIDRDCCAVGRATGDGTIRVCSADLRRTIRWFGAIGAEAVRSATRASDDHWGTYVLGVLAKMRERHPAIFGDLVAKGLDVAVASDVPLGSGLSSSASLEVSVATLLESMAGRTVSVLDKALACQAAEHAFAGVPCGIMDMLTSAAGRAGHCLLIDCRTNAIMPAPLPVPEVARVVVVNSNAKHELAGGEYAKRRAGCERAALLLGIGSLREAQEDPVSMRRLPDELLPLVRHVASENHRVTDAFDALHRGQLDRFGRLMSQSHVSLRDDYRVSCAELDTLVELLGTVPGVFGARMTGGGFGGSVVALAHPTAVPEIFGKVAGLYREIHGRECTVWTPGASDGAGAVRLGA